jgi:hypothetical protein
MRETVGPEMGVKASGGIRTKEDVEAMVAAGATRIGASAASRSCGAKPSSRKATDAGVRSARVSPRQARRPHAHPAEIGEFIAAYMRAEIADYHVSAWLMASFLRGLDESETEALTRALIDSGQVFD